MRCDDLATTLAQTDDPDPRVRCEAVQQLCPCHLKQDVPAAWDRLLAMVSDPDARVRGVVLHTLTDGSPRGRAPAVVAALERLHYDPDEKLRRRARRILAHYRRTGRLNIG